MDPIRRTILTTGAAATAMAAAPRVFAQGGASGAISGVVQDKSGAAVAGAKIKVLSESTKEVLRTETTDSAGSFTMTLQNKTKAEGAQSSGSISDMVQTRRFGLDRSFPVCLHERTWLASVGVSDLH